MFAVREIPLATGYCLCVITVILGMHAKIVQRTRIGRVFPQSFLHVLRHHAIALLGPVLAVVYRPGVLDYDIGESDSLRIVCVQDVMHAVPVMYLAVVSEKTELYTRVIAVLFLHPEPESHRVYILRKVLEHPAEERQAFLVQKLVPIKLKYPVLRAVDKHPVAGFREIVFPLEPVDLVRKPTCDGFRLVFCGVINTDNNLIYCR